MPSLLTRHTPRFPSISPRRFYSSTSKPISPHISFYTSHGRPIAKVLLGAVFTYQVLYWGWKRMEFDEERRADEGV